jgi:hypothetical protein
LLLDGMPDASIEDGSLGFRFIRVIPSQSSFIPARQSARDLSTGRDLISTMQAPMNIARIDPSANAAYFARG